jgi:hypothetical protein
VAETIELEFDPKQVLAGLQQMGEQSKELARIIEESLEKRAGKSVRALEEQTQRGTNSIGTYFRNLGTRVREDLQRAFDLAGIAAGAKFANEIGKGVKSVFEMERAFDKLNTRLKLTGQEFQKFKVDVGRAAASTGQSLETILPGVEIAAAKGDVKDPGQLAEIGKALGQVRATTGEDTGELADQVVEILKAQGKAITSQSFRQVLDAVQGTRQTGAFRSAGEAAQSLAQLAPFANRVGLNTRELGGLAAQATRAGDSGQAVLQQMIEKLAQPIQRQRLEAVLGTTLVKNGKFDAQALGKVDLSRFKDMSKEQFAELTGINGAAGGDFVRFIESFKDNTELFDKVTKGANETAQSFETATQSLAAKIDIFKQKTVEAGREIGDGLSGVANSLLNGDLEGAWDSAKSAGKGVTDNAGTLATAVGLTGLVGVLTGGAARRVLGGVGGTAAGLVKGEAAKAMGVQPVYVVNASEIGSGLGGAMGAAGQLSGKAGMMGMLGKAGAVGGALVAGLEIGSLLAEIPAVQEGTVNLFDMITKAFGGKGIMSDEDAMAEGKRQFEERRAQAGGTKQDDLKEAVAQGIEKGMSRSTVKVETKGPLTNPSAVKGRGGIR